MHQCPQDGNALARPPRHPTRRAICLPFKAALLKQTSNSFMWPSYITHAGREQQVLPGRLMRI